MSVGELRETLRSAESHLEQALGQLGAGRTALTEATTALSRLNPDNPETVVPPEARRADDQIERTWTLVEHILDTLRDYSSRI